MRQFRGLAKRIKLTHGFEAIVDDEDFKILSRLSWSYRNGYAAANFYINEKTSYYILMHRFLCPPKKGQVVDHMDGNPLNNQKKNLRPVSPSVNAQNACRFMNTISGFLGVEKLENGKFRARIKVKRKRIDLGRFESAEKAAAAYDAAALKYYGANAFTNSKLLKEKRARKRNKQKKRS